MAQSEAKVLLVATHNNPIDTLASSNNSQHPAAVYLASLSVGSRRAMLGALNTIAALVGKDAQTMEWQQLRYQHTQAIRAQLTDKYAPATVNKQLSALRGVLKECWRLGLIDNEAYRKASDLPNVKGSRLLAGRSLSIGEIKALIDACKRDNSPNGARDAAIIALAYGAGLRRAELVALQLDNFNQQTGELKVLSSKGGKDRNAFIANGAKTALDAWLAIRGNEAGAMFLPIRKGGKIANHAMKPQSIMDILKKRIAEAGIESASPHDLRRTFVSDLLDNGVDIKTVADMAGHANVNTTARYDRRGDRAKAKAAATLHVPF